MSPKLINVVIKLNLQYYLYSLYRLLQQDHMYLFYHYNHRVQSHLLYIFIYFLNLIKLGRDQGLLLEFRCAELCRIALNCTKIVRNCAQQCRLVHYCTEWEKLRGIVQNCAELRVITDLIKITSPWANQGKMHSVSTI